MELIMEIVQHIVLFGIASIPLITVFLHLKIFKLSPKATAVFLILDLLATAFFWYKTKELFLMIYQAVPYASSFIWLWAEHSMLKMRDSSKQKDRS